VSSYLTFSPLPDPRFLAAVGGVFSVALSVPSPRLPVAMSPGVTWQRAQWSPDFPRAAFLKNTDRDHPVDDERNIIMSSRIARTRDGGTIADDELTSRA